MSDPWQPWLDELATAVAANDVARIAAVVDPLWRFDFDGERAERPENWDRLFALLAGLLGHGEASIRESAIHSLWVAMRAELGPPWAAHGPADRAAAVRRRTGELLPALAAAVDAGSLQLLPVVGDLAHVEKLARVEPQATVEAFLADRTANTEVSRAALLAYRGARPGGPTAEELSRLLDDEATIVRAYAARLLGELYARNDPEPVPPLAARVDAITGKELERPGIAGPFVSAWYDHALGSFEERSGRDVREWFLEILAGRSGPEPDLLPCSNGVDFFAHEILAGRAESIERLVDLGQLALAVETATEIDEPIDALVPVLRRLAASADDDVARSAAWHLAACYGEMADESAARGFVARRRLRSGGELFAALLPAVGSSRPCAASVTIFPPAGERFDDAAIEAVESEVLSTELRGELVASGMPGDGDAPGPWRFGRSEHRRFRSGAIVERRGDLGARRWERLRILWRGDPRDFRPV